MIFDKEKHCRKTIRLKGWDYSNIGAYFMTICTYNRECLFGDISSSTMQLNEYGQITMECWKWLSCQYTYIEIDEWAVMPNHLHGIVIINGDCRGGSRTDCRGGSRTAPTDVIKHKPLGRLIGAFKTVSTKQINIIRNISGVPVWQRNYYEHIIRNEDELNRIRQYIIENPFRWEDDPENPKNINR